MGKKANAITTSKVSSTNSLAAPSTTASASRPSILRSAFAPSHLQLRLFASVIQSFDSQQLRIHDTNNGRLTQQHSARPNAEITCLEWGHYGTSYRESRTLNKKRKRTHDAAEDAVVAYGTSGSEVCMYSPANHKTVGVLSGAHDGSVRDFRFLPSDNLQAWSIGDDCNLVEWDLTRNQPKRKIPLTDSLIRVLACPTSHSPQIICASFTPFSIDYASSDDFRISSYDTFKRPVHTLLRSGLDKMGEEVFLAADGDRYMNVFDIAQKKIVRTLITSSEADRAVMYDSKKGNTHQWQEQMLAVVTREGLVELFSHPFIQPNIVNGDLKAKRRGMTKKADAQVKLVSPDGKRNTIPVYDVSFQGPDLYFVSIDAGSEPSFQKLRWQDEGSGELLFDGVKEVQKIKSVSTLNNATMNGAKDLGRTTVDESRVVVVNGEAHPGSQAEAIEISSNEEENEDDDDEAESDSEDEHSQSEMSADSDAEMEDMEEDTNVDKQRGDNDDQMQDFEAEAPTFGELISARHPDTIEIAEGLPTEDLTLSRVSGSSKAIVPSGSSLGTVLSQALRTNDQTLLEACLHESNEVTIQNTILRIDSSLAAMLLMKIAERLADRPGRWGHLMSWVQSTLIVHGGTIGAQTNVASRIRTLFQVLDERGKVLPLVLLLKGKLDMLNAQQSFREQTEAQRKATRGNPDEPSMIYIEGQDDNWSSDNDLDEDAGGRRKLKAKPRKELSALLSESESSDDEDMPLANGLSHSDSEPESDAEHEDVNRHKPGRLVDSEAEESASDDDDDNEEEGDDVEETSDDDDKDGSAEEDSSMDGFINDGSISEVSDQDDVDIDNEDENDTPQKPPTKRSKHR